MWSVLISWCISLYYTIARLDILNWIVKEWFNNLDLDSDNELTEETVDDSVENIIEDNTEINT